MSRVEDSIIIARPASTVWAFMTDPTNAPQWDTGILEGRKTSSGPVGAGTTIEATRLLWRRHLTLQCQIADFAPPQTFSLIFKPFGPVRRLAVRYTFVSVESGTATRLIKLTDTEIGGPLKPVGLLLQRLSKRENLSDLLNVKRVLETNAPEA